MGEAEPDGVAPGVTAEGNGCLLRCGSANAKQGDDQIKAFHSACKMRFFPGRRRANVCMAGSQVFIIRCYGSSQGNRDGRRRGSEDVQVSIVIRW